MVSYLAVAGAAYLLGSIPTGYLLARAKGIDIRTVGSGNIGATNVMRILGKPAGIFVSLMDALKGWVAVEGVTHLVFFLFGQPLSEPSVFRIVAAFAAVFGHNYTCWLNFKGGKGIATSAGVLAALVPATLMMSLCVWVVLIALTRYVSIGSIAGSFTLPFTTWFTTRNWTLTIATGAMGALAIYKHKANIQRLLSGTESRIGSRPKEAVK